MKFAITATDRFLGVFEAFVAAGWQPLKLFTVPLTHPLSNQQAVINFAIKHQAAIQLSRMTPLDLANLRNQGCEALIVASYDWKIPEWQKDLKYAVNFHSSPLPDGRGPYPASRALLEERQEWAVTCHKISSEIDQGDILAVDKFALHATDCHESLDLKIQMSARRLATQVAKQLPDLWQNAQTQIVGTYWPKTRFRERIINFQLPVAKILTHIRAFGATESIACANNLWFVVKRAVGWTESHALPVGQIVHVFNKTIVVSASDGYIGLIDCDQVATETIAKLLNT